MARYQFPLQRVLEYRRLQLAMEQAKWEKLLAAREALRQRHAALWQKAGESRQQLAAAGSQVTRTELAAVDGYAAYVRAESARLDGEAAHLEARMGEQQRQTAEAARRCRLLEKLADRRRAEWDAAAAKELEALAAEAFLARWTR